jgi:hypothetical protein
MAPGEKLLQSVVTKTVIRALWDLSKYIEGACVKKTLAWLDCKIHLLYYHSTYNFSICCSYIHHNIWPSADVNPVSNDLVHVLALHICYFYVCHCGSLSWSLQENIIFFTFQYRKNYPPVSKEEDKLEVSNIDSTSTGANVIEQILQ